MGVIYKYPLEIGSTSHITMPKYAKILCVQMQHNVPTIWALHHDEAAEPDYETRTFRVVGTGELVPDDYNEDKAAYIGTVQDGQYVWHIFEVNY